MDRADFHMTPDDFRCAGKEMVDWIAEYYERLQRDEFPVLSQVKPGEVRGAIPTSPPSSGMRFESFLPDVERSVLPGITHWQSPNFFGYFPANSSFPGILGDMLSTGLAVQGMLWATSPACTEVEQLMLDWLVQMLALPEHFLSTSSGGGVIQDSASSASLTAILAARERATSFQSNLDGVRQPLVAYTSSQAHSSIEKDIKVAGIGTKNLRLISVDENFAMDAKKLREAVESDRAEGLHPFFVSATVGTTSSLAIDPLPEIGAICREHGMWLHVDAAMAGSAAVCPEFRYIHEGLELADSYCFNPHKWMFTNFDCTAFFVRDRKVLIDSLSIVPEYLRNQASEAGAVVDYRDWHVPLGRRFRALKLWSVIRHYGVEGLQHHIRQHVALAQQFAAWVRSDERFEIVAPPSLNLVCFRLKSSDADNEQLLHALNRSGKLFMSHTKLAGHYTLRMSIGQTHTELRHVQAAWKLIQQYASDVLAAISTRSDAVR
ncbi:MAG TPA: pyridoxal-dependent decarboxylase [Terriglobales bacterium]